MNQPTPLAVPTDIMNAVWTKTPAEMVSRIALDVFGITGEAFSLSSERDETFLFRATDGARYVLKIASAAERIDVLQFQTAALLHLERHAPTLPISRIVPAIDGREIFPLKFADGSVRLVRLLTFLDGEQLYKAPSSTTQLRNLGVMLAELGLGLKTFDFPAPDNVLLWDLTHVLDLKARIADVIPANRGLVASALDNYETNAALQANVLPIQVIHNDFNPHNILVSESDAERIAGVIDFGDIVRAPLINDLAVALSYQIGKTDGLAISETLLAGYHSIRPLLAEELECLPALIRARLAMTVIITEWRAATHPNNAAYILRNHPIALAGLHALADTTDAELTSRFRSALGEH
jgi:Ser/Thr protein kinase RdoA (MazF antagonist)